MALELPMIIGAEPVTATVILYGFLQQNIMFEAFAGLGSTAGIGFLKELTTIFSMIGMLVLFFSPSLWKAKYIVSWVALFLIVTLGGSMGFEFGYNFADSPSRSVLNQTMHKTNSFCSEQELIANDGVCTRSPSASAAIEEALVLSQGKGSDTVGDIVLGGYDTSAFKVVGFYPQVLAMYVTNKLAFNLRIALSNLEQKTYRDKKLMIDSLQHAQVPESQLKVDIAVFDKLCSADAKSASGLDVATVLSLNSRDTISIANKLKSKDFTLSDATNAIEVANSVNRSDKTTSPVLIDLLPQGASTEQTKEFHSIMTTGVGSDKNFIRTHTVNQGLGSDPSLHKNFANSSLQDLTDKQALAIESRDIADNKAYKQTINKLFANSNSSLSPKHKVSLVMPNTQVVKSIKKTPPQQYGNYSNNSQLVKEYQALNHQSSIDDIQTINNCGELMEKIVSTHDNMMGKNIKDLKEQAKIDASNTCSSGATYHSSNQVALCNSQLADGFYKTSMSAELRSDEATSNYIEAVEKSCDRADSNEISRCNKAINGAKHVKKKAEIVNAQRSITEAIESDYELSSSVDEGVTGAAQTVGENWTKAWAAPLIGLKSISESFKAGAYKALLPLIRDILMAFILVLTPIFFLLGLLVPSWAPGVIITCIFSILFLQMIDVTMILIDSLLGIVRRVLEPVAELTNNEYTGATFDAMIETIWAMAYMASFAITAFLMFAVGNSKAILTKLAGMDSTIQSASQQIAQNGWDITKAGASIAAGAATGGAMGGALGAKTANAIAGGQEFAKIADERGFKEAFNSVGGTTAGNYAKRREAFRDSGIATMSSESEALGKQKRKVEDKNMIWDEKVSQGADKAPIETDNMQKKATDRADKKTRLRDATHAHATNIGGVASDSVERAKKDQGVAGPEFKGMSKSIIDPSDPTGKNMISVKELSVTEQFEKELNAKLKKELGYDPQLKRLNAKNDRGSMSDSQWKDAIEKNEKAIEKNKAIINKSATMSSAIAQGTYKNMSANNIYKDSKGNMRQGFDSLYNVQKDIAKSMSQANMSKADIVQTTKMFKEQYVKQGQNGSFNIPYKQELKAAKSKNTKGKSSFEKRPKPGRGKFSY